MQTINPRQARTEPAIAADRTCGCHACATAMRVVADGYHFSRARPVTSHKQRSRVVASAMVALLRVGARGCGCRPSEGSTVRRGNRAVRSTRPKRPAVGNARSSAGQKHLEILLFARSANRQIKGRTYGQPEALGSGDAPARNCTRLRTLSSHPRLSVGVRSMRDEKESMLGGEFKKPFGLCQARKHTLQIASI